MADGIEANIEGMDVLLGKLHEVTVDIRHKGGRFALRKAAQVVREAAKDNARRLDDPETANKIADNIVERWSGRRFKRTGDLMFRVGVLGGARGHAAASGEVKGKGKDNPGGDTFYWRFVEFGTEQAPAQPFMRPAIERNVQKATDEFVRQYDKALTRALKRAKKKTS